MGKKGNRTLYKLVNKKTGTFYMSSANRINNVPKKIKKFDAKTKKHVEFDVQKMK
ncbi:MAG: 50S ribosomal protein L33 [bacterium]